MEEMAEVMRLYREKWGLMLQDVDFKDADEKTDEMKNTFYISRDYSVNRREDFLMGFLNMSDDTVAWIVFRIGDDDDNAIRVSMRLTPQEFRPALFTEPLWLKGCSKDDITLEYVSHRDVGLVYFVDAVSLPVHLPYYIECEEGIFEYSDGHLKKVIGPMGTSLNMNVYS